VDWRRDWASVRAIQDASYAAQGIENPKGAARRRLIVPALERARLRAEEDAAQRTERDH
jgi:hypothetical protein